MSVVDGIMGYLISFKIFGKKRMKAFFLEKNEIMRNKFGDWEEAVGTYLLGQTQRWFPGACSGS